VAGRDENIHIARAHSGRTRSLTPRANGTQDFRRADASSWAPSSAFSRLDVPNGECESVCAEGCSRQQRQYTFTSKRTDSAALEGARSLTDYVLQTGVE
jgi:hypothetical protein